MEAGRSRTEPGGARTVPIGVRAMITSIEVVWATYAGKYRSLFCVSGRMRPRAPQEHPRSQHTSSITITLSEADMVFL
jgi:hypothetical protein